jgi:acid phosphatase
MALGALFAGRGAAAVTPVPQFAHVIVVVFENKDVGSILGSKDAPTFNAYARRYARLTRYFGVTHPSLPNYLALVSGSTQGITTDCTDCVVSGSSLADSLEAAGRSWKTYAEGLPAAGFLGGASGLYAKKHDPFAYFRTIINGPGRRARIVPLTQLAVDLRGGSLPDFALVVPNLCNSMHDCPVRTGDSWLRATVPPLLRLPKTAVFIIFDEGSPQGRNQVAALVLGTAVRPRSRFAAVTGHYGLLRTVEAAWRLPLLGHSADVAPISGIWK